MTWPAERGRLGPLRRAKAAACVDDREAGFTLLEVLIVVAILGLMAGLVLARGPQRSATLDIGMAGAEVSRALREARARAIATGRPVVFRLDVAAHAYAVDGASPHALPAAYALSMVAAAPGGSDGRQAAISFAPDGSSSGGRIAMADAGRRVEVDVDWLTGRVSGGAVLSIER